MHVGFIGLGAMGRPMATNILQGGHRLTVHDVNEDAVRGLCSSGASAAASLRKLAADCDLVITMLPAPADVEHTVLGDNGLLAGANAGTVIVDMGTGNPGSARELQLRLAERDVAFVDCPVGRTQVHAEAGTLLLLAGGERAVIDRVRPVLDCVGSDLVHCGGPGTGQAMKLVNNMLATIALQGVAEALSLGLAAGLSLDTIRAVTGQTMAQTSQLDKALPAKTFAGDLTPGFALALARKDVGLAADYARELGVPVPVAERTLQRCSELIDAGHGRDDIGIMVAASAPGVVGQATGEAGE
jgi:4-hydroxybutyrate dehydrogenase/sulfolactaldehyde 3-reductase